MLRRIFLLFCLLLTIFLLTAHSAHAQKRERVYRLGYLSPSPVHEGFRQRLRELGYIEGKNLAIEFRLAKQNEQYPALAAELVRLNVDCILVVGVAAARAAKDATRTIPIVMGNASDDPVRLGLVASLARPGGNVTGVIDLLPALAGKRLELLKETFPKLSRVAHLHPGSVSGTLTVGPAHFKESEAAARALGIQIQALEVLAPDGLESAFQAALKGGAEALVVVGVGFIIPNRKRIVDLELKFRLPAMHTHRQWVPDGGLLSYTTNNLERYRRAATYVDKILRGTNAADLPVERMTKFVFQINLKTAKHLGLTIPPNVLARADRVIR